MADMLKVNTNTLNERVETLHKQIATIEDFRDRLIALTNEYKQYGVAHVPLAVAQMFVSCFHTHTESYFRELASEQKRMFLHSEEQARQYYTTQHGWRAQEIIELTFPANKKTHNMAAGLSLVARPISGLGYEPIQGPVVHAHTDRKWRFIFTREGFPVHEAFLKQCREDPVFRILLQPAR
jgi:hypothetical protein